MEGKIRVLWGDITLVTVDAVVNAANCNLSGGEGVDGAIRWAAGSGLERECADIGWCDTGDAVITGGYALPARYVIHGVGPLWQGGGKGEDELLARCYRRCFQLARAHGVRSIAFPVISCGVYRFPLERGSRIAVGEALRAMESYPELELVWFVVQSAVAREVYLRSVEEALIQRESGSCGGGRR